MRFILNFIFFGILFYVIYLFFPEAFSTMVGWAHQVYEFLRDLFLQIAGKFQDWKGRGGHPYSPPQRAEIWLPLVTLKGFARIKQ